MVSPQQRKLRANGYAFRVGAPRDGGLARAVARRPAQGLSCRQGQADGTEVKLSRCPAEITGDMTMLKGGLLWLIGIPLPIILILFFLGYLS
jgi:hypothetical protein